MAERTVLEATKRELTGKQVRQLRAQGQIPGVLYGPEFAPISLLVNWLALRPALAEAGGTHLIDLNVDGEVYNALVRNVQRRPIRGDVLHVDFYRVRMDVKIRNEVPIVLLGDMAAFEKAGFVVLQEMASLEVECLPGDLPAHLEVSVAHLKAIGDLITLSDIPELPGVVYHGDPAATVATLTYLLKPEEAAEEGAKSAEPELIRRRAEDEEEEE